MSSVSALRLICQIGTKNLEGSRTQKVGEEFRVPELKIPKSYFQRYGAVILLTRHVFCFASHLQNWTPLVVSALFQNPKNLGGIFASRIINFEIVFLGSTMYFAFYFIFSPNWKRIPFLSNRSRPAQKFHSYLRNSIRSRPELGKAFRRNQRAREMPRKFV